MKHALIDISNMVHRARHAIPKETEPQHLIGLCLATTFMSMRKAHRNFQTENMVVAFDCGSWRHSIFDKYKSHRRENETPKDVEIREGIATALEELYTFLNEKTNVIALRASNVEADDFIARWIELNPHDKHLIVSTDGDFKQLITENIKIYNGVMDEIICLDGIFYKDSLVSSSKVKVVDMYGEKWKQKHPRKNKILQDEPFKVEPEWELFLKIMKGDPSDNIPAAHVPRLRTTKLREAFEKPGESAWKEVMSGIRDQYMDPITGQQKNRLVEDYYEFNKSLIDMKEIPEHVKNAMDDEIVNQIEKPERSSVGFDFIKFCTKYKMINIANEANSFAKFLTRKYE